MIDEHFDSFQQVYDERFQAKVGYWAALSSSRWQPFSSGALPTAIHDADEVCFPVAHRQVVLTIPKRLRLHTWFDRKLLGKLSACAWTCLQTAAVRLLGREDVTPGMMAAIQTHGELLHWHLLLGHPHIHVLVTCGALTPEGDFLESPEFDLERRLAAWQDAVFALHLAEEKIEPEVDENIRSWPHSGFRVDQSVLLPAGGQPGIERLVQYMTRCPFSQLGETACAHMTTTPWSDAPAFLRAQD